ncbi:tyrosine-type recombinase/integrase [Brachyspira intermedia]|uniref:tyrosine-type recombinase/integrase n=1 Tax=Brachyspira intermedia TaxID=84377 RepID=UPI002630EE97|nr:tyrosine-type recombinase/integrase [uncultured Brachyspira sp.]
MNMQNDYVFNDEKIYVLLEEFSDYLQTLNFAAHTINSYNKDLKEYFQFLHNKNIPLDEANHYTVRDYLTFLKEKSLTNSTMSRHLSSIKKFYKYLIRNGYSDKNRIVDMKSPKREEHIAKFLSIEDIDSILAIDDEGDFTLIRDKMMALFMYAIGLRVSELASLRLSMIKKGSETLRICGKGSKVRDIPILPIIYENWDIYMEKRRIIQKEYSENNDYLFINRFGKPISDRSIRTSMKRLIRNANISIDFSPHTLRHTFATHLLNNDAEIRGVQELLGHETIATTQRYTHVTNSRLFEVYNKFHPHSNN